MKLLKKSLISFFVFCVLVVSYVSAKNKFDLFDPGEDIIDYSKYGTFQAIGTDRYKYVIDDMAGLEKAAGEGVFPNTKSVLNAPDYKKFLSEGKLDGSHWKFLGDNAQANFYKWATASESPAVKLFYIGQSLEKAGLYLQAIKAYYAIVVYFPRSASYAQEQTFVWYLGPVAIDLIKDICKKHPELGLKLVDASINIDSFDDTDLQNDIVITNPGRIIQISREQRAKQKTDILKSGVVETRGGKVQLVKFSNGHWQLKVKGKPFVIKGLTYGCTPVGQSAENGTQEDWSLMDHNKNGIIDGPFEAWVDENKNNKQDRQEVKVGDFKLLKEMGCNTIRIYHEISNDAVLDKLYAEFGIMSIIGDFVGMYGVGSGASVTDYSDATHRARIMDNVRKKVMRFKDKPYLLIWMLGNENNYGIGNNYKSNPAAYYQFVNEIAKMIRRLDPDHPIAICNGDTGDLELFAYNCPDVDIFGTNAYRGGRGFVGLWEEVKEICKKPVLITEYGCPSYYEGKPQQYAEEKQAEYHLGCWQDIAANFAGNGEGNSLGGVVYEWIDEWWLSGSGYDPNVHDTASRSSGPFPDGWGHSEWFGITSQGDGKKSPFLRQLRESYYLYKKIWNEDKKEFPVKLRDKKERLELKGNIFPESTEFLESKPGMENNDNADNEGDIADDNKGYIINEYNLKEKKDSSLLSPKKAKVIILPLLGVQVLLAFKVFKKKKNNEKNNEKNN